MPFGIMATSFGLLKRGIEVQPESVEKIIMACCILHNFLRRHAGNMYMPPNSVDQELNDGQILPGSWREEMIQANMLPLQIGQNRNPSTYAKQVRDKLAQYLVTKQGEVV